MKVLSLCVRGQSLGRMWFVVLLTCLYDNNLFLQFIFLRCICADVSRALPELQLFTLLVLLLGTAALLFMPPPGSLLLPFSKICQVLFDADPFPVKVGFLLFQGSSLHNLTASAISCFPL